MRTCGEASPEAGESAIGGIPQHAPNPTECDPGVSLHIFAVNHFFSVAGFTRSSEENIVKELPRPSHDIPQDSDANDLRIVGRKESIRMPRVPHQFVEVEDRIKVICSAIHSLMSCRSASVDAGGW